MNTYKPEKPYTKPTNKSSKSKQRNYKKQQQELEQELQGLDSKARESKLQEIQREQERKQREKERQERLSSRNTINKDSHLILESNDKNNVIIFLDSANSLSNLIHIHNERIDIFTKDTSTIDIQEIINQYQSYGITLDSLHSSNTQIFLYSQLLLGSKEIESNPLFFGELDKEGVFIESKPIYHLIGESNYDTKDSKESFTQTLQVFLDSNTLTLLNYSLLDSSLNIKLESNSKESQAILEKEKVQRKQKDKDSIQQDSQAKESKNKESKDKESQAILEKEKAQRKQQKQDSIQQDSQAKEYKNKESKDKDSKNKDSLSLVSNDRESQTQDSSLTASNDDSLSTSMLHPILEDNEIKCPHNGVVKFKSNKGKTFTSKGIPMVLESDLLNASIIGVKSKGVAQCFIYFF